MKRMEISGRNFWSEQKPSPWQKAWLMILLLLGVVAVIVASFPLLVGAAGVAMKVNDNERVPRAIPVVIEGWQLEPNHGSPIVVIQE